MVHQEGRVDAAILVAGTGRGQDRFINLKVVEKSRSSTLSLGDLKIRVLRS